MKKNIISKAKNISWLRVGKWRTPLFMEAIGSGSLAMPALAPLGYRSGFRHFLMLDGECYLDERENKRARRFFSRAWQKDNTRFLKQFYTFNVTVTRQVIEESKFLIKIQPARMNNRELTLALQKLIALVQSLVHLNVLFVSLDEVLEQVAHRIIAEYAKKLPQPQDAYVLLGELTPPKRIAHVIREEDDLLEIASAVSKKKGLVKIFSSSPPARTLRFLQDREPKIFEALATHRQRYAWLAAINLWGPLYGYVFYLRRIRAALKSSPLLLLRKRVAERKLRECAIENRLQEIKASPGLKKLIARIRDLIDLKQSQFDAVSVTGYRGRPLLTEVGRRLDVSYDEVLQLTPQEIEDLLKSGAKASKRVVQSRLQRHAMLRVGSDVQVFQGAEVIRLRKQLLKNRVAKSSGGILKGRSAFPGLVTGRVRIIPTIREVYRMRKDEILVCPMTDPDFMPAIRKAKAIVTDEGGILAHAAIVSRELKIPCVVGTKVATQVLKNGDLVEVDANKGVVRILERK